MILSNPFSPFPSSSTNVFSSSNSFLDYEKDDDVHLNNNQQIDNPFISADFVCHTYTCPAIDHLPPQVTDDVDLQQQQISEDHNDLLDAVVSSYLRKMETSKNDGHSKICTSRGVRDRRVRLSIDISRKFFCLQDLLGFDKASKTLDWLLTKSLTAIKDLVQQTSSCNSSTITDESKARFLETIREDHSEDENSREKRLLLESVTGKAKRMTRKRKAGSQKNCVSREQSRAEARARAKRRTKEKNRVKSLDECGQIEQQNRFEDSKQLKDSSFQIRAFYEQLEIM